MLQKLPNLSTWVITEGIVGTENQCLGVADSLGVTPLVHRVRLRQPWKMLSPYLGFESRLAFDPSGFVPAPPWPQLLIASGRKAIAAARYIKNQSPGTIVVILQDPRVQANQFDLVAVPAHDPTRGPNVMTTLGAPNRITPEKLEQAQTEFPALEARLPAPRVAVLIGGNSKSHTLTPEIMKKFAHDLKILAQNYSLMITTSRRTGADNLAALQRSLAGTSAYLWDNTGANPYFAFLALADYIIVTSDSVSMLSEAATTGKPVYRVPLAGGSERFDRFYTLLDQANCVHVFDGALKHWTYTPLAEADRVANRIREILKQKGLIDG